MHETGTCVLSCSHRFDGWLKQTLPQVLMHVSK